MSARKARAPSPGPACYGRGGTQATVTDADLALGYLDAEFFLGGAMKIDGAARRGRVRPAWRDSSGCRSATRRFGVHDVVNENMAGAARVAIAERGRVPREYALLATGGAGPVHAWHVARKLGIQRVVCPPGGRRRQHHRHADGAGARIDRVASFNVALACADLAAADRHLRRAGERRGQSLRLTGADIERRSVRRLADMRYIGQGSEITVALPPRSTGRREQTFETAYRALFARTPPGAAIQFVALRLSVSAPMPGSGGALRLPRHASAAA